MRCQAEQKTLGLNPHAWPCIFLCLKLSSDMPLNDTFLNELNTRPLFTSESQNNSKVVFILRARTGMKHISYVNCVLKIYKDRDTILYAYACVLVSVKEQPIDGQINICTK